LGDAQDASLPRGDVFFLKGDSAVVGARIEVKSLDVAQAVMRKNGLEPRRYPGCAALWLPPSAGHGLWLEFVSPPG